MKKMVLGLSLSLAALGFLLSPAMAATSPPQAAPVLSAEDQDFLASLATTVGTPTPELAAKKPAIRPKSVTCTANCAVGGTVSCTAATNCSAVNGSCPEPGHVVCNGVTTSCPACGGGCPPDWCTQDCTDFCAPCAGNLICNATACTSRCKCDFIHCAQ